MVVTSILWKKSNGFERKGYSKELWPNKLKLLVGQAVWKRGEQFPDRSRSQHQNTSIPTHQPNMSASGVISAQIETFQQQGDLYTKKIEIEKRRISELDKKLQSAKGRLSTARRSMGGVNEAQDQMRFKQRHMHVLENKLEKTIVRLNEATAFNQQKRRDIEDLRREKLQRDAIEKSQMNKLNAKKVELVEIIEQSQRAMEARDLARAQIVALKKRIGHEVNKFEVEWGTRMSKLETDRKM